MGQSELLAYLCKHLQQILVRYFITGSQATIAYGQPRFTNDIDVVVELDQSNLESFCLGFPEEEFYLSQEAARQAVAECGMFNIIHPTSGLKIDVMIPDQSSFDQIRLERGLRLPLPTGGTAIFASPEDIIVKKMEWHSMGGGERHLDDIKGILRVRGEEVDKDYISKYANQLGVQDIWRAILDKTRSMPNS